MLDNLIANAITCRSCEHINRRYGPGKFVERFATEEEKEQIKNLTSKDLENVRPDSIFLVQESESKTRVFSFKRR